MGDDFDCFGESVFGDEFFVEGGGVSVFAGEDLVGLQGGTGFGVVHFVVFGGDVGVLGESCSEGGGGAGDHDLQGL